MFVASIIRNRLCIIYEVFYHFFQKSLFTKNYFLISDKFNYPGSIVYLSCCSPNMISLLFTRRTPLRLTTKQYVLTSVTLGNHSQSDKVNPLLSWIDSAVLQLSTEIKLIQVLSQLSPPIYWKELVSLISLSVVFELGSFKGLISIKLWIIIFQFSICSLKVVTYSGSYLIVCYAGVVLHSLAQTKISFSHNKNYTIMNFLIWLQSELFLSVLKLIYAIGKIFVGQK